MRAAVCREYGPPEVVRVEELPAPAIADGQVRVRVRAAAVNYPDVLFVANRYQATVPVPFVPGSEFAGVVVEGSGELAAGERVFGTAMAGAFGEEIVVTRSSVRRIPAGVQDREAAAFGVAHRTAYHVLRTVAGLRAGEELVVLGAGGGVGLAAVQLGALFGGSVTAVASSEEKLEAAAQCGARHLVNYRAGDLRGALRKVLPGGADVVVDPVGGELSEPALRALRWGGRFVTVGYASGVIPSIPLNLVMLKGVRVLGFQMRDLAAHLADEVRRGEEELMGMLGAGRVRPHIGEVFGLEETAAALRCVADGRAVGKVVIDVAGADRAP